MNRVRRTLGRQFGLSLLEVLIAIAIMALALGVLYRSSGGSLRAVFGAELRERAILQAESLLALKDVVPKAGWNEDGEGHDLRWTIRSAPFMPGSDSGQFPALHRVVVTVFWRGLMREEQFELTSVLSEQRVQPKGVQ